MRHGSTKVRNRVAGEFAYNPIEGLRYAVAYNLFENFSGENATEENLSKVEWKKEHGIAPLQPERYKEIVKELKNKNEKLRMNGLPLSEQFMLNIWEMIHEESLRQQR